GGDGVHAGSEEQRGIDAFEFRNRLFGNRVSGITVAGVEHVGGCGSHLLIAVGDFKSGSLVDRSGQRPILLVQIGAPADCFRFRVAIMLLHASSLGKVSWKGTASAVPKEASRRPASAAVASRHGRKPAPSGIFHSG